MTYLIASDIHGSDRYATALRAAYDREAPDRLILLGDILYHGPRNDLPDGYAPKRVIETLNALSEHILCVRGNCDSEVDQNVLAFPIMSEIALLVYKNRLVYLTHGHIYGSERPPKLKPGDFLLTGHTHIPAWEAIGSFTYLNPGSVSIPKAGSQRSYMTLDDEGFHWKALDDGATYHSLPV